jgi:predicted AlkP superfamily phosphohydrolase/phosphomutase
VTRRFWIANRRQHPHRLALALGLVFGLICSLGLTQPHSALGATDRTAKILVIGFDGMDPQFLDRFIAEGLMSNFERFIAAGDYRPLGTAIPPQSPVAWSNFITGQNPGGHGIFDFIHRDPKTLIPYLSTSEAKAPAKFLKLGGWKLPRGGGGVELLRHGTAFWEYLADAGVDVTIFKVPSNFPPVATSVRSLSGMGTPDILGTYGIFSYVTDRPPADMDLSGGRVIVITLTDGHAEFGIPGPVNTYREGDPEANAAVAITVDPMHPAATFVVDDQRFLLQEGEWSEWQRLEFEMVPHLKKVSGICRFYLMQVRPEFRLYVTPVQIDPSNPEMPISTPTNYARELSHKIGPYYTQGLPDDTKALEEGVFSDRDYVEQSNLVLQERFKQFEYELDRFCKLPNGFMFFYFNSPDQTFHMFWRNMDAKSPMYADAHGLYSDRARQLYQRLDEALGMAVERCGDALIIAMSDHGFAPYYRSFHVNSWLLQNGYLHLKPGVKNGDVKFLGGIDWRRTRAYAIGINGLYLNLQGREQRGIVQPGSEREQLLQELVVKLEAVQDVEMGRPAIKYAYRADEVYSGPYRDTGPDIIIGYHRGFRGSNESALGEIPDEILTDNMLKWSGDHCMAADEVPGIIAANRKIQKENPNLLDMAPTILALFGLRPPAEMVGGNIFIQQGSP